MYEHMHTYTYISAQNTDSKTIHNEKRFKVDTMEDSGREYSVVAANFMLTTVYFVFYPHCLIQPLFYAILASHPRIED